MTPEIGYGREARYSYGFDEVALVPSTRTIDPADVDTSFTIGEHTFEVPIIAAAMDSSVDVPTAALFTKLGGLAVLNLLGLAARFENPSKALDRIRSASAEDVTAVIQEVYSAPLKEELAAKRVSELKKSGAIAAVSVTPQHGATLGRAAVDAGLDILVIQSTVTSNEHQSSRSKPLRIDELCKDVDIPVIVGNCVGYQVALDLMRAGASGILVGIGPGAACTSRGVLGIGAGQITATADVAKARDDYLKESGRYVAVITDGGMSKGGEVVKALAAGGDAVMIGSAFARAKESPGRGYHWGMATADPLLPRGSRIDVKQIGTLEQIIRGPATGRNDGSLNLLGAIRTSQGVLGCRTIKDLHSVEMVVM
ncbi:MAG TPA: GuaB3 family IMP dehydrogenase-related protein, partial [Firmicutes bacterium]|nr:GuaB3 family IMP dehydrogenase-related protein [Bacillota bacterium]